MITETHAPSLLLLGGRLWSSGRKLAEDSIAVRGGRILALDSAELLQDWAGEHTQIVDLAGRTVIPGLSDCHAHLASQMALKALADARDLYDPSIKTLRQLLEKIEDASNSSHQAKLVTIEASPMQDRRLREKRLPTLREMDDASPDRATYVTFGAHVTVANSAALRAAGIDERTPDPPGGVIEHDENGSPTGVLRESAQWLLRIRESDIDPHELADRIELELERCATRGVTTIHDIVFNRKELLAYQILHTEQRLSVRVRLIVRVVESGFDRTSLMDLGLSRFGSDMLSLIGIKVSIDGGITGMAAAFSPPLSGSQQPVLRVNKLDLEAIVFGHHVRGIRCCIHAIGDVALDMALDAFEKAINQTPRSDHRHRIEHGGNWTLTSDRIRRIRDLGLTLIPNPVFRVLLDEEISEALGPERSREAFPIALLVKEGIPLAFGSDGPAYWPIDPLRDVAAAIAVGPSLGAGVEPTDLESAMTMVTANASWAAFDERLTGRLQKGMAADLTILSHDPWSLSSHDVSSSQVDATICNGQFTYQRSA